MRFEVHHHGPDTAKIEAELKKIVAQLRYLVSVAESTRATAELILARTPPLPKKATKLTSSVSDIPRTTDIPRTEP